LPPASRRADELHLPQIALARQANFSELLKEIEIRKISLICEIRGDFLILNLRRST